MHSIQHATRDVASHCTALVFTLLVGAALVLTGCDSGLSGPELPGKEAATGMATLQSSTDGSPSYVLTAGKWKARQTRAVERAGGTITFSHESSGIGVVTADAPNFLQKAMASGAFTTGGLDEMVAWQPPSQVADFDPSLVTPGDETFFGLQWNMQSIEAPAAWAAGFDGAGARVAVIDGGFYDAHPDLSGLEVGCSTSFVPGEPFNNDTGTFWHGTHVAGIVAGADNEFGVIGVAPGATLMGVKALHDGGGSFGAVIGSILFASDPASFPGFESCERADIINMSLAAVFQRRGEGAGPLVGAMAKAVNFAASQNVLVISAAANNGADLGQSRDYIVVPAEAGSGLAISATGPVDFAGGATNFRRFASYSNWGENLVFAAAPGGDFTLAPNGLWFQDMVLSTCRGSSAPPTFGFCFSAGTSMAAPAAAGVAALIKGANPNLSLGALKAKLKNTADDEGKVGKDEFYGHGFVNARRAVTE